MRRQQGRSAAQTVQALTQARNNTLLGVHVQSREGVIEQQHGGAFRQGTRQGQTLTLATRKAHALLTNDSIQTLRKLRHEIAGSQLQRGLEGRLQLFCGWVVLILGAALVLLSNAHQHVLTDRAGEKHRLLKDERGLGAYLLNRHVGGISGAKTQGTGGRLVETRNQRQHGRLAATGCTHQRQNLAREDLEVDVLEHGNLRRLHLRAPAGNPSRSRCFGCIVAELNVIESDRYCATAGVLHSFLPGAALGRHSS